MEKYVIICRWWPRWYHWFLGYSSGIHDTVLGYYKEADVSAYLHHYVIKYKKEDTIFVFELAPNIK